MYSYGEIYGNVSINDVQKALDNSSGDLGILIRNGNINKWARYKPISYPGVNKIRSRDIISHSLPNTPDPVFDAKTGLNIGTMTGLPSDVASWEDVEITYERPTGGTSSPFRLTDFSGYNRYAQKPAEFFWRNTFKKDQGMVCTINIYDRTEAGYDGYISFSDLISDPAFAPTTWKRLCIAVYDVAVSDNAPIFYFFSEKFQALGSATNLSASTNMSNTAFTNLLTVGKTYKFVAMLVTNHAYLEEIVTGDRERWEYGVSPSEMATMETGTGSILALCLAFENGEDRCTRVLQDSSVIIDRSYFLGILSVDRYGNIIHSGIYEKLCTKIYLPTILVRSLQQLNGSDQYQMRVAFSTGIYNTEIFRPTDKVGNDYFEIETTTSTSMPETPLTPWVSVSDLGAAGYSTETDSQGRTIHVYEFDFPNRTFIITSNEAEQTQGGTLGLFLFFDQQSDFALNFTLYHRPSNTQNETLIKTLAVHYSIADNGGYIHDIEW